MNNVVYPVKDLAQAKSLYSKLLGMEPYVNAPYYVGFRVGGIELGLDPRGHDQGQTGPVGFWAVDDIAASLEALTAAGAEVQRPVSDVGGGRLIATVQDVDGNVTGLVQSP
jgi:predicted enzyme related to lactoylglutathione lyase